MIAVLIAGFGVGVGGIGFGGVCAGGEGVCCLEKVVRYVNVQSIGCGLARVRCEVEIRQWMGIGD